jgi:hypothetical protein
MKKVNSTGDIVLLLARAGPVKADFSGAVILHIRAKPGNNWAFTRSTANEKNVQIFTARDGYRAPAFEFSLCTLFLYGSLLLYVYIRNMRRRAAGLVFGALYLNILGRVFISWEPGGQPT